MYICICNAISEGDLRRAARCCMGDAERVYDTLGKQPQCRQCLEDAQDILLEERESQLQTALAAA